MKLSFVFNYDCASASGEIFPTGRSCGDPGILKYFPGPSLLLHSARRQGSLRQLGWGETQNQTVAAAVATPWQRSQVKTSHN